MLRTPLLALVAAALMATSSASAKETVTFGYLADPSHEAVLWAVRNGKVSSDLIEIEAEALQIPALIQATVARTYDVVQTAGMSIPRARERGLDLRIIGTALRYHAEGEGADIWVLPDSPLQSAEDLKGKKLAVYSIGSSGITLVRIALANAYGLDVSLENGDLEIVEMPPPAMPSALSAGRVDAATLIHAQAFEAQETGAYRSIVSTAPDNFEQFGVRMVSAVLAGYGDKLEADPEIYREFLRVLHESVAYAEANPEEVFAAVADETGAEAAFFARWFEQFSEFPVLLTEDDRKAIQILWEEAKELGLLENVPPVEETIWDRTLTAAEVR